MCLNTEVKNVLPRLEGFVGAILKSKNKTHLEVYDIIHSSYILMHDRGLLFSFENIKQPIYDTIRGIENEVSLSGGLDNGIKTSTIGQLMKELESKHCKGCSNTLPVAFFHKHKVYPNGIITYQTLCKECQKENNQRNKLKRLSDPLEYEKHYAKQKEKLKERREIIKKNPLLLAHFRNEWKMESRERRMKIKLAS